MAATAYPPGGTFLDTMKKSFVDVPVDKEHDNAISTEAFLEAAESLTTLFGMWSLLHCSLSAPEGEQRPDSKAAAMRTHACAGHLPWIIELIKNEHRCPWKHGFPTSQE